MAHKLFLGGIAPTTQTEDLQQHFGQYGSVVDAVVMYKDGKHRGFGFVTFGEEEAMLAALAEPQVIHDRTIDVKPAVPSNEAPPPRNGSTIRPDQLWGPGGAVVGKGAPWGGGCAAPWAGGGPSGGWKGGPAPPMPRPTSRMALPGAGGGGHKGATDKVFIGGLAATVTDEMLSEYFGKYGTLVDVVVMKDKLTGKSRGFGFVRYDNPAPVELVMAEYQTHELEGKWMEVKRAVPQEAMAPPAFSPMGKGPASYGKGGYGGYTPAWGPGAGPPGAYAAGWGAYGGGKGGAYRKGPY